MTSVELKRFLIYFTVTVKAGSGWTLLAAVPPPFRLFLLFKLTKMEGILW